MQTERPPLRNPYDAFTGSDLDTFVANIREKVGNALNPRPTRTIPGLFSKHSATDQYISDLARSARSEATTDYEQVSSPPPTTTLDKGKGRALDEGPGLPPRFTGKRSEMDESEASAGQFLIL